MARTASAGVLLFRRRADYQQRQDERPEPAAPEATVEVLLAHMGGPFWARKDERSWTIPKGEFLAGEDPFDAAMREFAEEMGSRPPTDGYVELGTEAMSSAKDLTVWAAEADFDSTSVVSNTFQMEWPPRSGRLQSFPEVDRAAWFGVDAAKTKLVAGQVVFLDLLIAAMTRAERGG